MGIAGVEPCQLVSTSVFQLVELVTTMGRTCVLPTQDGSAAGQWRQPSNFQTLPRCESYRNSTAGKSFSWDVPQGCHAVGELRRQAFQEHHLQLMEAVRGNPDDTALRA
jgi:hypothetical protein